MSSSSCVTFAVILLSFLCHLVRADNPTIIGSSVGGVVGLIILILDIIAIVDILRSGRDIVGKLLWILLIVLFPIGGLIIWLLCGRKTSAVI